MQIIDIHRFKGVKWSFTTRIVDLGRARTIIVDADHVPAAGEIALAVVDTVGHHKAVESVDGRRSAIFPGDEILLAYGNRYAPDQFEAYVPDALGPCHLAAGGGIAANVVALHGRVRPPTDITVTGVLGDSHGRALNLAEFALPARNPRGSAPVICVCGTSMNAGKTSSMAVLVRGLTRAGHRVGPMKATGTGAGNDLRIMRDSGAIAVLDFTDAGFATTFRSPPDAIEAGARHLRRRRFDGRHRRRAPSRRPRI
ncbi:MAG: hypothetical protein ACOYJQ_05395 [Pseudochelatococcus sp.]|jgi:hypothetical protein|uniref:hypothetical protein n=1 Tax=Pseudochelatococcus sp. TaxID=2020869 RepID=UPI003D94ACA4